jgi:hypothetical protein
MTDVPTLTANMKKLFGDVIMDVSFRVGRPQDGVTAAYCVGVSRDLSPAEQAQVPQRHGGFPVVIQPGEKFELLQL